MKKTITAAALVLAVLFALSVTPAVAGSVYDRSVVTVLPATGAATFTNSWNYSAVALKRIWATGNANATNQVTATRVLSDNSWTQTVGTVTCASGAGSQATLTAAYMKPGDTLVFSSLVATGCTVMIEYEVQQH